MRRSSGLGKDKRMANHPKTQLVPEVQQLADLLANAAKSSPVLWQNIKKSVDVAELTCNSVLAQKKEGTKISSETETSTVFKVREFEEWQNRNP